MFKNRSVIVVVFCLLIVACVGSNRPEKPANLIPKDKMSDILYDLYIINAAKGVNRKILEKNGFAPETYVLTKYSIDSTQFTNSNNYYAYDTDDYRVIVENVKSRLEKEKAIYEKAQKVEGQAAKRRRDSISASQDKTKGKLKKKNKKVSVN